MKSLRRFFTRLVSFATRRTQEERLREEIEEHIALQAAENLRAGLPPVEARRQAMLKFGGVEAMKQDYRAERGLLLLENLLQDVRFALRSLYRTPGLSAFNTPKTTALAPMASISVKTAVMVKPGDLRSRRRAKRRSCRKSSINGSPRSAR